MQKLKAVFWVAFVVIGTATLIGLGFWQLGRLQERRASNAQIASRMQQPARTITGEVLDPADLEYRPATASGSYDYAQEIILRNRTKDEAPGVDVITPLKIAGSDKAILIDRGWIPYEYSQADQRKAYQSLTGPVTVTGLIRLSQERASPFSPSDPVVDADMPRLDAWYWLNIPQIQQQFRTYQLLPFYIEQDPGLDPTALPSPAHDIQLDDGPHLSYAIQWFSFATILVVGSVVLARRNMKRAQGAK